MAAITNEQVARALQFNSPTANALVREGYVKLAGFKFDPKDDECWAKLKKMMSGWQRDPEMVASATIDIDRLKADIQNRTLEKCRWVGRSALVKLAEIFDLDTFHTDSRRQQARRATLAAQKDLKRLYTSLFDYYRQQITEHVSGLYKNLNEKELDAILAFAKVVCLEMDLLHVQIFNPNDGTKEVVKVHIGPTKSHARKDRHAASDGGMTASDFLNLVRQNLGD